MLEMQMFHAGSSFQLRVVLYPAYRDCHAGDGGVGGISPGGGTHGVLSEYTLEAWKPLRYVL